MYQPIQLKTRTVLVIVVLGFVWLGVLPKAQAVVPAPDGGYPGFTTAEGTSALQNLTTGVGNTAAGWHSLFANSTGNLNTAIGAGTLLFNTGDDNTATGALALFSNTGGLRDTANGAFALFNNTTGDYNTGTGDRALFSNITGGFNTANGSGALFSNTIGQQNTGSGESALYSNTIGNANTALGSGALLFNAQGGLNTAVGTGTLLNTDGDQNTAVGTSALFANTTGSFNIAIGSFAGDNLTTGSHNIDIDNDGVDGESGTIRIGNVSHTATYVAGISGQTVGLGGSSCYVDNDGKLGVFLSAQRYKENIQRMDDSSGALYALKPVTFRYKPEFDKSGTPQFGLVAEEVAAVNPDLVTCNAKGEISTVRYEAVNAMLLNEFLKEHCTVQAQQKDIDALRSELKEQRALIQKLNEKVELSKARSEGAAASANTKSDALQAVREL